MATKNIHLQIEQFGTLKLLYVVASKLSRNSLEEFMGTVIVNKEMDSDILGRLRDAVRRKRLKKMYNQHFVCPSKQCSSTPVGLAQGFLNKEQSGSTGASPMLIWLQLIFNCFLECNQHLKGRRLFDAVDIFRIWWNGFQECFRLLYSRGQKRIFAQWEHIKGNVT